MAKKQLILDFSEYDLNTVVADIEQIRRYNPQRYEMEQLTAICYENLETKTCVGYKDLAPEEFWARGHMPGMPLMPGVIMCEAAAQLASYYSQRHKLMEGVIGFGGLEEVRFRGLVRPGDNFQRTAVRQLAHGDRAGRGAAWRLFRESRKRRHSCNGREQGCDARKANQRLGHNRSPG